MKAARVALKKRCAEVFLKRMNLPADGRLVDVEIFRRLREAASLDSRMKQPQFVEFHRSSHMIGYSAASAIAS
jgi:hypothetical protein